MSTKAISAALTLGLALLAGAPASAQPEYIHKATLQTQAFPQPGYVTTMVRTVVDPGAIVARHTHPGVEMAYIDQGHAMVKIDGQPDQPVQGGGAFSVPDGVPHSVRNTGHGSLVIISTYVVDTSKPIASPAP